MNGGGRKKLFHPFPLVLFCFDFTLTGTSGKPNEQLLSACEAESVWYFYQCAWGHGCVFACERPNEWESQALLGLTAASWCCSRKSCWTCACLLAASLCVSLCVSLPRQATLGVGPDVFTHRARLPPLSSGLRNIIFRQRCAKTHTFETFMAVLWLCPIMWLK